MMSRIKRPIQTLDAIDGKQARRTDTQSPLGELFDHGCDSLSTIFVSLSVMITVDSISSEPFYFAGKMKKVKKKLKKSLSFL